MEKAYDLKDLGKKITDNAKAEGLYVVEEATEKLASCVYFAFKAWAKESALLSETKIDDLIAPFYDQADAFVLPQIKKIDLNHDGQ